MPLSEEGNGNECVLLTFCIKTPCKATKYPHFGIWRLQRQNNIHSLGLVVYIKSFIHSKIIQSPCINNILCQTFIYVHSCPNIHPLFKSTYIYLNICPLYTVVWWISQPLLFIHVNIFFYNIYMHAAAGCWQHRRLKVWWVVAYALASHQGRMKTFSLSKMEICTGGQEQHQVRTNIQTDESFKILWLSRGRFSFFMEWQFKRFFWCEAEGLTPLTQ